MKSLDDKSINLVLTDPPYGTTACKWDSVIPFEPMWKELKRVCSGTIALFGSEPFSSALRLSSIKDFKYDWIWRKNTVSGFAFSKHQPMRNHESISIFGKTNYYPQKVKSLVIGRAFNKPNGRIQGTGTDHYPGLKATPAKVLEEYVNPRTVLEFKTVGNQNGAKLHPTQKPVPLLEYLIKTYTLEGETVLDFTMGSGSTGIACKNLNRKFIGIEKDKTYFEIAKSRIQGFKPTRQYEMSV
jgi:site-specific DNA-methyltransferase (adenine-specific)